MLSVEETSILFKDKCHYCGIINMNELNGIDRMYNDLDYTIANSVTCCTTCNFMKSTLNECTFILMCSHISRYNKLHIEAKLYPFVFNNHKASKYRICKSRATERKIEFNLSEDDYEILKDKCCYICGKENSDSSTNGIDRINNDIGYTVSNCESCCCDCNILKQNLSYDDLLTQCKKITEINYTKFELLEDKWTPSNFLEKRKNNFTKEERDQRKIINKQNHKEKYDENYTDEAIVARVEKYKQKFNN